MRFKNIFLSIGLVSAAATAQAQYTDPQNNDYFSGPYLRASAFYQSTNSKLTLDNDAFALHNLSIYTGHDTWGGDLGLGYGRLMNQVYYIGAEIYAKAIAGEQKIWDSELMNLAVKTPFAFGAMAKLGYSMTPNSLIYVGLGAERSQFKLKAKLPGLSGDIGTNHKWAFVPSLGTDLAINCNWQVGARLSYASYHTAKFNMLNEPLVSLNNLRHADFALNLTYRFV